MVTLDTENERKRFFCIFDRKLHSNNGTNECPYLIFAFCYDYRIHDMSEENIMHVAEIMHRFVYTLITLTPNDDQTAAMRTNRNRELGLMQFADCTVILSMRRCTIYLCRSVQLAKCWWSISFSYYIDKRHYDSTSIISCGSRVARRAAEYHFISPNGPPTL